MTCPASPFEIPKSERTPVVEWLLNIRSAATAGANRSSKRQKASLEAKVAQLEVHVSNLDEQLKASKKLTRLAQNPTEPAQPSGGGG